MINITVVPGRSPRTRPGTAGGRSTTAAVFKRASARHCHGSAVPQTTNSTLTQARLESRNAFSSHIRQTRRHGESKRLTATSGTARRSLSPAPRGRGRRHLRGELLSVRDRLHCVPRWVVLRAGGPHCRDGGVSAGVLLPRRLVGHGAVPRRRILPQCKHVGPDTVCARAVLCDDGADGHERCMRYR